MSGQGAIANASRRTGGSWTETWGLLMCSKSDFELRTQSFSWISLLYDAHGEPSGDRASALISGSGYFGITARADRSFWKRFVTAQLRQWSMCCATLKQSGDLSQT